MNKELWVSVTSLILMTIFMIFSTMLYFSRSRVFNNAQIYNGDYTDMGFEIIDNHVFLNDNKQEETYSYSLKLKYRENGERTLNIFLDLNNVDIEKYNDKSLFVTVLDANRNIIIDKTQINLTNNRINLFSDKIINHNNYEFIITLNIYSESIDGNINSSDEIASKLSADLI